MLLNGLMLIFLTCLINMRVKTCSSICMSKAKNLNFSENKIKGNLKLVTEKENYILREQVKFFTIHVFDLSFPSIKSPNTNLTVTSQECQELIKYLQSPM